VQSGVALHDTEHDCLHATWHDVALTHETELDGPVAVTVQCDCCSHVTLPELPTVTLHVESTHVTLPLAPVVSVHVAWTQFAVHDSPHIPAQLVPGEQLSEQLLPASFWQLFVYVHCGPGHAPPPFDG
jgi:hypothetical protein